MHEHWTIPDWKEPDRLSSDKCVCIMPSPSPTNVRSYSFLNAPKPLESMHFGKKRVEVLSGNLDPILVWSHWNHSKFRFFVFFVCISLNEPYAKFLTHGERSPFEFSLSKECWMKKLWNFLINVNQFHNQTVRIDMKCKSFFALEYFFNSHLVWYHNSWRRFRQFKLRQTPFRFHFRSSHTDVAAVRTCNEEISGGDIEMNFMNNTIKSKRNEMKYIIHWGYFKFEFNNFPFQSCELMKSNEMSTMCFFLVASTCIDSMSRYIVRPLSKCDRNWTKHKL